MHEATEGGNLGMVKMGNGTLIVFNVNIIVDCMNAVAESCSRLCCCCTFTVSHSFLLGCVSESQSAVRVKSARE